MTNFIDDYPWLQRPLVSVAPMRLISLSSLASAVSNAGGIGFIGAGNDASTLSDELAKTKSLLKVKGAEDQLPIGIGFILWAGDKLLNDALPSIEQYKPAAVWLFAPEHKEQYTQWTTGVRRVSPGTKVWIQIGTVADAKEVTNACKPDVLVVQGTDAGGHGLQQGASIVTLLPEVDDAIASISGHSRPRLIAAGGIMDGRGVAAAFALGADGVTLGTRYLAAPEANIAQGYQKAVLNALDGGVTTARGKLYDTLRGTTDWPDVYGGRGVLNLSWHDASQGMSIEENKRLYDEELKKGDDGWGPQARLTTYAGTGVGLVSSVADAASITNEVRKDAVEILRSKASRFS